MHVFANCDSCFWYLVFSCVFSTDAIQMFLVPPVSTHSIQPPYSNTSNKQQISITSSIIRAVVTFFFFLSPWLQSKCDTKSLPCEIAPSDLIQLHSGIPGTTRLSSLRREDGIYLEGSSGLFAFHFSHQLAHFPPDGG